MRLKNKTKKVIKDNNDKEIYEYAIKKLEIKHENKRHLEIKSLSVLQACAISITLFTGLLNYSDKLPKAYNKSVLVLKIAFYILTIICIFCLLVSLDDSIANKFKKGKSGLFQETQEAQCIFYKNMTNPKKYYINIIHDLSISSGSLSRIIKLKNRYLQIGIRTFIASIGILIIMGLFIA